MSIVLNLSGKWKSTSEIGLLGFIHDFEKHQSALASIKNIECWSATLKNIKGFFFFFKQKAN